MHHTHPESLWLHASKNKSEHPAWRESIIMNCSLESIVLLNVSHSLNSGPDLDIVLSNS